MKTLLLSSLLFSSAWALPTNHPAKVAFAPTCIGYDSVPIPEGSAMEAKCCENHQLKANAPASCKGFLNIADGADANAGTAYNLAFQSLNTANSLTGTATDFSGIAADNNKNDKAESPERAAMKNAGAWNDLAGDVGNVGEGLANKGGLGSGGSGAGAGAGGGGSAGDGYSKNRGKSPNGLYGDNGSGNGDGKDARFAYIRGEGSAGGADEKGVGVADDGEVTGMRFPGDGSGANGNGQDEDGNSLAGADEDGVGVPEDPSDYFSRTDKSANLFKIVSNRYLKKKSLWKTKAEQKTN